MNVLVVGGGVAGLGLAAGLRGRASVTLADQAPAWRPLGAGLLLHANAMAALTRLGVDIDGLGAPVGVMRIADREGDELSRIETADLPTRLRTARVVHRAALHERLLAHVDAEVRLGTTVTEVAPDGAATLSDGTRAAWDLVVGADGLRSRVRQLLGGGLSPRYLGYTCWRWIGRDPGLDGMVEMWGRGRRVGLVPLGDGRLYGFLVENAPAGTTAEVPAAELPARFAEFRGSAPAALAGLAQVPVRHDDLHDLGGVDWGKGRVLLVGDAAHAQTPNLGQGAATALEDAAALAGLLPDAAETAVPAFVARRDARVRDLQSLGRRLGVMAQWSHPLACWVRDTSTRLTPGWLNRRMLARVVEAGMT